jgi:hypothetical protein
MVKPLRVAGSPVHLEYRRVRTTRLPLIAPADNRVIEDGMVIWDKLCRVGRLGYLDYSHVETSLTHVRPTWDEVARRGGGKIFDGRNLASESSSRPSLTQIGSYTVAC